MLLPGDNRQTCLAVLQAHLKLETEHRSVRPLRFTLPEQLYAQVLPCFASLYWDVVGLTASCSFPCTVPALHGFESHRGFAGGFPRRQQQCTPMHVRTHA